jgi:hypothetical protein
MAPKEDAPPLILRVTARGIIPAAAIDAEIIGGLTAGTDLSAKPIHMAPSKALRAWWFLLGETVKLDPERLISARALSNHILLKHHLHREELLIGGGARLTPMSLTDFTESDLWRLVEVGKRIITVEIMPGLDCDLMLDQAQKKHR